jgi:hypothetical protein
MAWNLHLSVMASIGKQPLVRSQSDSQYPLYCLGRARVKISYSSLKIIFAALAFLIVGVDVPTIMT